MKNKNGFTMVELLAVITIMGILMGIGVVSVQKATNKSRDNFYKSQRSTLTNAASSYLADHKGEYPIYVGQSKSITLETLQSGKYIGEFTDHSKNPNSCDTARTKVVVVKTDTNHFNYYTVFNCSSMTDQDITGVPNSKIHNNTTESDNKLNINFKIDGYLVKKYTYVIHKGSLSGVVIRTNTVTPSSPANQMTATINIEDIKDEVSPSSTEIYFVTTNGSFGHIPTS